MDKIIDDYKIIREKDPASIVTILDERLYEFNSAVTGRIEASLYAFTVRDTDATIVAGITGWIWAGVSEITIFWINENRRRQGIGTKLLAAAELEAKASGCSKILVKSYSFQAPLFYQKLGFRIVHELEGFPEGYTAYTLVKDLN